MRTGLLPMSILFVAMYVGASFVFEKKISIDDPDLSSTSLFRSVEMGGGVEKACTGCHVLNQVENGIGPHLVGVVGRRAGSVSGYSYSKAMLADDGRWTRARLRAFIQNPQAVVPGTAMNIPPIDARTADAIVNYLSRKQ